MDFLGMFFDNLGLTKDQRSFIMRAGWVTFVSIHILWVCGWLQVLGFAAPYALANEFNSVATEIRASRLETLQQQILSTRYSQCRTASDSPPRIQYNARLDDLYQKYIELSPNGKPPRVPSCDQT